MADILRDPRLTGVHPLTEDIDDPDLRAHRRSFHRFGKIVGFAALHVATVLVALALMFLGHAPIFGIIVGLGVTIALVVAFVVTD